MCDIDITSKEVGDAHGTDGLPPEIYKGLKVIPPLLTKMFEHSS